MLAERGTAAESEAAVTFLLGAAVRQPGHLFEATAARIMAETGRTAEAAAELDRLLPRALAASGPRWVDALADLALVAARTGQAGAARRLAQALAPYRGRLVVWGGANSTWGPVSHYLGLLAATTGETEDAIRHFEEATELEDQIGALPYLAHSLDGLAAALTARAGPGDAERAAQARRRARELAGTLGLTHLFERLVPPPDEWTLTRDGDDWVLEAGAERARLRDGRGPHYLRALLATPGRDIAALDLAARPGWRRPGPGRSSTPPPGTPTTAARRPGRRTRRRRPVRRRRGRGQAGGRAAGAGGRAEPGGRTGRPSPARLP